MEEIGVIKEFFAIIGALNMHYKMIILFIGVPLMYVTRKFVNNEKFREDILSVSREIFKKNIGLKDHILFKSKIVYKTYITNIDFGVVIKNNIFKIILTRKTNAIICECTKFMKDTNNLKDAFLETEMAELIDRIIVTYEDGIKLDLQKQYKDDAEELFRLIYTERFAPYHNKNVLFIVTAIRSFNNSRISKEQKLYMLYNLIYTALELSILDCEKTFDELNGHLKQFNDKWHKTK
jgi:hypothetical protein